MSALGAEADLPIDRIGAPHYWRGDTGPIGAGPASPKVCQNLEKRSQGNAISGGILRELAARIPSQWNCEGDVLGDLVGHIPTPDFKYPTVIWGTHT